MLGRKFESLVDHSEDKPTNDLISIAVLCQALRRIMVEIKKLFAPICVNGGGIMSELPESITPNACRVAAAER